MRPNKIKELWRQGKPASVGWISSGNTLIAEVLAHAGFDGIVVDMQHGMALNADKAVACMQAISTTETVPIVRVPWNDPKEIQTVLDAGAYGIIVPLVNTYEEAAQAAAAAKYPPAGFRSNGPNRATLYAGGSDYFARANDEIFVLVMIETEEGLANLEEIAKAPGIDGFYIGPADLAIGLGITPGPGMQDDPKHVAACKRILEVAQNAGLVACHHGGTTAEDAIRRFKEGFLMAQLGSDVGYVRAAAAAALDAVAKS
jgi:4-hydroxy-2-oxoheptanedioate aldolase